MSVHRVKIAELMQQSGVGFGTSGARGRVDDMRPEVCYAYTRAFLQHLEASQDLRKGTDVALAGDLRPSTPDIMAAVALAVVDAGYHPVNCGFVPSPAVALYGIEQGIPSIMVTGSHIPDDRNGIKFNRLGGEILKEDELGIKAQVVDVPEPFPDTAAALPAVDDAARRQYVQRYLEFFSAEVLQGMSVGVYEHSGVGRDLLAEILEGLGAKVTRLNRSERFIPVDTEAVRPEDAVLARQWADSHGFDAVVSTDGDADRPLVGDEHGYWLRGDVIGVLCAAYLGIKQVATPVSSNTVVDKCGLFDVVERTRIGSPFVIAAMERLLASAESVAGYEANGGFLLASPVRTGEGRTLSALPTRDAVIVILTVLAAARERGLRLSELVQTLPPRFTASDRLKSFPTEQSQRILASLRESSERAATLFRSIVGSELKGWDDTDGLRLTFANEEVVHLRPSGNAPEFRCYNEAGSRERVERLNSGCMALLAGWREHAPF